MDPIIPYQLLTVVVGLLTGGGIVALMRVRHQNRRDDASSALTLNQAYRILVDDLRKQIDRQDQELRTLRSEVRDLVIAKDKEITALRAELDTERRDSGGLRRRVAELEAKVLSLATGNQITVNH